ncbi:MAG: CofH family radical SAM protein [Synechococcaceae cyanobacterium]|nr:CofH family radical SAM protein [Synechococcaceae cyanobacterium]
MLHANKLHEQPPPSLCPRTWEQAGDLLVLPPPASASRPYRAWSFDRLLASTELSAFQAQPVSPGLALALLERSWSGSCREALRHRADQLRARLAGETVSYVLNRNLNASNHCQLRCGFCAFRRDAGQPGAYRLTFEQLEARAAEARRCGATELCLQSALDPLAQIDGSHLRHAATLLNRLQAAAPGLHLHAFSPQELLYIAEQDNLPLDDVLQTLQDAGLGSVPGTAAEVLSDRVRRRLCPEKLSSRAWLTVMAQVHRCGLRATATLMAGHLERPADLAAHLLSLVALQRSAWQHRRSGFSEFVLLPFVGAHAPSALRRQVGRDQPDVDAMLTLTAQARLLLGPWFVHHQPSWVKLTLPVAAEALRWGCDDLGGTLMEEHITTMAGARGGTSQTEEALRDAALSQGRPVRQRTTLYGSIGEGSATALR